MITLSQLFAIADEEFSFLSAKSREVRKKPPVENGLLQDGWMLEYALESVNVRISYYGYEFEVNFAHDQIRIPYLLIDSKLNGRRSGYHGSIFTQEKMPDAIRTIAGDLKANYEDILSGNSDIWIRLQQLVNEPEKQRRLP